MENESNTFQQKYLNLKQTLLSAMQFIVVLDVPI